MACRNGSSPARWLWACFTSASCPRRFSPRSPSPRSPAAMFRRRCARRRCRASSAHWPRRFWSGFSLRRDGGAPTGEAIREIGLLLVAPLIAGQLLRPWIGGFVLRQKAILSATDRGSILLVVYGAFGHAVSAGLWRALPISGFAVMIVIEALVLAFMLFATRFAAKTLGFNREDTIAIVFCGSKKSLAAGVPMAGVLVRRPGPRHDPPADHALSPDAAHGLRSPRPPLGRSGGRRQGGSAGSRGRAGAGSRGRRKVRAVWSRRHSKRTVKRSLIARFHELRNRCAHVRELAGTALVSPIATPMMSSPKVNSGPSADFGRQIPRQRPTGCEQC